MGTRNVTAVFLDGEYKVAQYGQWDGYPSGQGATALAFLQTMDRDDFINKVRKCDFVTDDQAKEMWDSNPQFSRDHGAAILDMIAKSDGLALHNSLAFVGDSLMCEWAYVIDLDANTFEVYKGFNYDAPKEGERFAKLAGTTGHDGTVYHPCKIVAAFPLYSLPTEKGFLKATEKQDEEE